MKILAIDTSSLVGSVAAMVNGTVLAESSARVRASHSEEILTLVTEVLARAGLRPLDLDLLAVGIGPGSFTGVRIGMATARGIRLAAGVPLVGVSSLDAMAASVCSLEGFVLAALDGRRDEVFGAGYRLTRGLRAPGLAARHASPEVVADHMLEIAPDGDILVVTDLPLASWERLRARAPERFVRAPAVLGGPLGRFVAHEAAAGRALADDGTLEPMYVRTHDAKLPSAATR